MGKQINAELFEHIDGLRSYYQSLKNGNNNDDINV